jgi:hypothetical protein
VLRSSSNKKMCHLALTSPLETSVISSSEKASFFPEGAGLLLFSVCSRAGLPHSFRPLVLSHPSRRASFAVVSQMMCNEQKVTLLAFYLSGGWIH